MELSLNELKILKKQFAAANPIGIFNGIEDQAADNTGSGESMASLEEKGILHQGGLSREARELLETAADPELCCRFVLQESSFLLEKYTYRKGDNLVLVENAGGVLNVSKAGDLGEVMMNIGNFTGLTPLKRADFEIALNKEEIYVLLALFDIYREKTMLAYCRQPVQPGGTFSEIRDHLDRPNETGLVAMIQANYDWKIPPIERTKVLLESLKAKKAALFDSSYLLTGEYAVLGSNFLACQFITTVEVLELLKDGRTALSGILYLSAGLKDNLLFIMGDDEIELSTVSSAYALKMFEAFLKCPRIV